MPKYNQDLGNEGRILGFNSALHDASIAFIDEDKILFAAEEERFTRIKAGINAGCIPVSAYKAFTEVYPDINSTNTHFVFSSPYSIPLINHVTKYEVETFSHHLCHAAGAYYTSGIKDKCLVVSLDGGGLTSLGRYYLGENGKLTQIHRYNLKSGFSPANFYAQITHLLGWKVLKDEGKVVGLAGLGKYNEKLHNKLKRLVFYRDGDFISEVGSHSSIRTIFKYLDEIKFEFLKSDTDRFDFAFTCQFHFENLLLDLFNDLHSKYPEYTKVVVSGGPFANVKANKKINELPWVEELYVYPPMGDMGLSLGAAIYKSNDMGYWKFTKRLDNVFLGLEYSNDEILRQSKKYNFAITDYVPSDVAKLLDRNYIVGFFQGKFEFGPRALGARSILMKVTEQDGFKKLNDRLGRHEVMPFAPVVLDEYADTIFDIKKSRYSAEFMTICYDTKPDWIGKIPAVVHSCDNTARPQIVVQKNNPKFYEIVDEYRKVSGLPILLNTSFNGHNEPIINSPDEAFVHLEKGSIDYLVIGNLLFFKQ